MGVVQHSVLESGFDDTAWSKEVAWSMEFLDGYPLWHFRGAYPLALRFTQETESWYLTQLIGFAHWSKGDIDVREVCLSLCMYQIDTQTNQFLDILTFRPNSDSR